MMNLDETNNKKNIVEVMALLKENNTRGVVRKNTYGLDLSVKPK